MWSEENRDPYVRSMYGDCRRPKAPRFVMLAISVLEEESEQMMEEDEREQRTERHRENNQTVGYVFPSYTLLRQNPVCIDRHTKWKMIP